MTKAPEPREKQSKTQKLVYGPEHHRLAFETWVKTRNWKKVAESIGGLPSSRITAKSWSRKTYRCKFGCPWHGWQQLEGLAPQDVLPEFPVAEVDPPMPVAPKVTDECGAIPEEVDYSVDPEVTILHRALTKPPPALAGIAKTTLERLQHLEYIYAKTMHFMTGVVLPSELARNPETGEMPPKNILAQKYKAGSLPVSYEQGAKLLVSISREVQNLKREFGVFKQQQLTSQTTSVATKKLPELTIQELVTLRDLLEVATPVQQTVLGKLLATCAAVTQQEQQEEQEEEEEEQQEFEEVEDEIVAGTDSESIADLEKQLGIDE